MVEEIQDIQLARRIGETYIENRDMYQSSTIKVQTIMSVFVYGFVTLIALIGVTNILNTILTGIRLRSREFAMLRSIGMTPPKSFNKMLQFESLYFGVMALMIGLPPGHGLELCFFMQSPDGLLTSGSWCPGWRSGGCDRGGLVDHDDGDAVLQPPGKESEYC